MAKYKFEDIFDKSRIDQILRNFTKFNGIANAIIDLDGNIISANAWKDACTKFHRVNKITQKRCHESDTELSISLKKGDKYSVYICKNGLVDVAVPLLVDNTHIANFFIGQFFIEEPVIADFEKLADEVGFEKEKYIEAIKKVPVVSEEKIKTIADFLTSLVTEIGEYGLAKLKLLELNSELNDHREHLEELVAKRTRDLEDALVTAEKASQAKSNFLANMSHEIRTPMNAILGFSEVLSARIMDPQLSRFAETIFNNATALLNLINDILDLSKVEAGKLELQYAPISITNLMKDIKLIFQQKIEDKGLGLHINIDENVPNYLTLDLLRIKQILINLINNAIKFTEKGYISVSISSIASQTSNQVNLQIIVEDTGIGVAPSQHKKIFGAFEQSEGQDICEFGGTGLGLAITKQLITMMNGTITLESDIGKGAKFIIKLHDIEKFDDEENISSAEKDTRTPSSGIVFASSLILICDDVPFNRELIKTYLEDFDFTILEASNGKEALQITKKRKPSLILLDMKMPVMDGFEASRLIKSDPTTATIPIVAVTASVLKSEEKLVRRYCDDFIRKPINRSVLLKSIMNFIEYKVMDSEEIKNLKAEKDLTLLKTDFNNLPHFLLEDIYTTLDSENSKQRLFSLFHELSLYNDKLAEKLHTILANDNEKYIKEFFVKELKEIIKGNKS
jgi:signal transduction histidine kinase/DNA-binding NarL/FixJ family response regulator